MSYSSSTNVHPTPAETPAPRNARTRLTRAMCAAAILAVTAVIAPGVGHVGTNDWIGTVSVL